MGTEKSKAPGSRLDEMDSFWELSDIVPKRRRASASAHDTEPVTVCVGDDGAAPAEEKIRRRTADRERARYGGEAASDSAFSGKTEKTVSGGAKPADAESDSFWELSARERSCAKPTGGFGAEEAAREAAQLRDGADDGIEPQRQGERLAAAKRALTAAERKYLGDTRAFGDPMRLRDSAEGVGSGSEETHAAPVFAGSALKLRPKPELKDDQPLCGAGSSADDRTRDFSAQPDVPSEPVSFAEFPAPSRGRAALREEKSGLSEISAREAARSAASCPRRLPERDEEPDASVPLMEYSPGGNPMLNRVCIYRWPAKYTFYGRFRSEALALWEEKQHTPCSYVPFFSFMPLPHQLGEQQRAYYLFWREELMQGSPLVTDFSYILLFIYEIINMPDRIAPEQGIHFLCLIWSAYRASFPKLDRYLVEWVCDYCLIHNVMPEMALLRGFYREILDIASFKEFYIGCGGTADGDPYAEAVFAYASDYNWHESKFLTPENEKVFETHMRRAFMAAFERFRREEAHASGMWAAACRKSLHASLTRDSYSGALCAYDRKRRITVVYKSCMRTPELRFFVTGLIKYTENQIRSLLGIKSRFHVQQLEPRMKEAVDRYFEPYRRRASAKRQEPPEPPAYEKQYDAAEHGFDAEKAMRIEALAWNTTGRLTAAFSEEADAEDREGQFAGMHRDVLGYAEGAKAAAGGLTGTADRTGAPAEAVLAEAAGRTGADALKTDLAGEPCGAEEPSLSDRYAADGAKNIQTDDTGTEAAAAGRPACGENASGREERIAPGCGIPKPGAASGTSAELRQAAGTGTQEATLRDAGFSGTFPEKQSVRSKEAAGRGDPENGCGEPGQDGMLRTAFRLLLDGLPQEFSAYAGRLNLLPETLAERLNDMAYELLGDIAVEADENGGFRLLPDYREEIEAWMSQ